MNARELIESDLDDIKSQAVDDDSTVATALRLGFTQEHVSWLRKFYDFTPGKDYNLNRVQLSLTLNRTHGKWDVRAYLYGLKHLSFCSENPNLYEIDRILARAASAGKSREWAGVRLRKLGFR